MRPVGDDFLLTLAAIAATLVGLLLLGGFFYLETGLRGAATVARKGTAFLTATINFILVLYGLVLAMSLALVVFRDTWAALLYLAVCALLLVATVRWVVLYHRFRRAVPSVPISSPWITSAAVVVVAVLPWASGGTSPTREDFVPSMLVAAALAVLGTVGLLLAGFDLGGLEQAARAADAQHDEEDPEPTGGDG